MTANELADELQELDSKLHLINLFKAATMLRQQEDRINVLEANQKIELNIKEKALQYIVELEKEIEALKADAERYRYLRNHCYKLKYPNSEIDRAMELKFVVSGVWSDNKKPEVLDGLIDEKIGEK
jgi:hypothetical protein